MPFLRSWSALRPSRGQARGALATSHHLLIVALAVEQYARRSAHLASPIKSLLINMPEVESLEVLFLPLEA